MRILILALLLTGCAAFGPPTLQEQLRTQQTCSESWACRTFIEDRPLQLVATLRNNALDTQCSSSSTDSPVERISGSTIVALDGRRYAVGYSWTCPGICSEREAKHSE